MHVSASRRHSRCCRRCSRRCRCRRCCRRPSHASAPAPRLQLRCQLVCTAWRHALDARRWPLWRLEMKVDCDLFPEPPLETLWVLAVRPAVRRLRIDLGGEDGFLADTGPPIEFDDEGVRDVHSALLALHPPSVSGGGGLCMPAASRWAMGHGQLPRGASRTPTQVCWCQCRELTLPVDHA